MKAIAVLVLLLCNARLYAQECDCKKKFDSVHIYLRKNYVGFIDKVTPVTQQTYSALVGRLRSQAATIRGASHCMLLINRYLRFFRDQHLVLMPEYTPVIEKIALSPAQLELLEKPAAGPVMGIYESDSMGKMALVKSPHGLRQYAAVVLQSPRPAWSPGDVVFELAAIAPDKYDLVNYSDHRVTLDTVTINKQKNGLDVLGWQKAGADHGRFRREMPAFTDMPAATTFFRQVDDSTGYLRIGGFTAADFPVTDSVLNANDEYLRKNPRLIIDIRDNGEGTDKLTERLRPLLYTQPVRIVGADFLATTDNIAAWSRILDQQSGQMPEEYLEQTRKAIHQGDGLQGRLVSMGPDENMILPAPLPAPAKVAVVVNNKCSNAAEQFLLEAVQSSKVKVYGTPTAGALDYSNVNEVRFTTPACTIRYPVTRSRRVAAGQGIDNKGIQPSVKLNFYAPGWLEEVVKQF